MFTIISRKIVGRVADNFKASIALNMNDQSPPAPDVMNIQDRTMQTLTAVLAQAISDGYKENFRVIGNKLVAWSSREKRYAPDEIYIQNFYRFEGESNPDDEAILYSIQTTDGTRGTLVDAYGPSADVNINSFVLQVHDIRKQTS